MKNKRYWLLSPFSYVQLGIVLFLILLIFMMSKSVPLKIISLLIGGGTVAFSLIFAGTFKENIYTYVSEVSQSLDTSNKDAINNIPVPAVTVSEQGEIVWYNELFREVILLGADAQGVMLPRVFKGFDELWLADENKFEIKKEKKVYLVTVGAHRVEDTTQYVMYFNDITDLKRT